MGEPRAGLSRIRRHIDYELRTKEAGQRPSDRGDVIDDEHSTHAMIVGLSLGRSRAPRCATLPRRRGSFCQIAPRRFSEQMAIVATWSQSLNEELRHASPLSRRSVYAHAVGPPR